MGTRTKTTSLEDDIAQEEALLTDQECEEAVVCAMLNGEAYNADTDNLSPDCFACEHTRAAFLAIGERKGKFKGMLRSRKFNIVLVGGSTPAGDVPAKGRTVRYDGRAQTVSL